jgi:ribosomal protein L37E
VTAPTVRVATPMTVVDTETRAGVTVQRTWSGNPAVDPHAHLVDQRCTRCGAQVTDDDRGPFYDSVTDDGTPHACPVPLPVVVRQKRYDDEDAALVCPRCGNDESIIEVDRSERWNRAAIVEVADDGTLGVGWREDGDWQWEHDHFRCEACGQVVTLPAGYEGSWS